MNQNDQKPMTAMRTVTRVICIAFLSIGFLLGCYVLVMCLLMEGMRHSQPSASERWKQLFEVCFPVVFFGVLLLISLFGPSPSTAKASSSFAGVYAIAWLAHAIFESFKYRELSDAYALPFWSAIIMVIAAVAARWLYTTGPHREHTTNSST